MISVCEYKYQWVFVVVVVVFVVVGGGGGGGVVFPFCLQHQGN